MQAIAKFLCAGALMFGLSMCGEDSSESADTFTAYALDVATLPVAATATAAEIVSALAEHELATSTLTIRSMR